jgi:AAA domain
MFNAAKFRANLPAEMLAEKRFVRYFLQQKPEGGTSKVPLANHSDPNSWSTFDEAVADITNSSQGIGYCLLNGDVHGLDIDHCRNARTGRICNEAMLLLSRLGSWAEYSVSGQGIHVLFKGEVRGKQLTETCIQYWNPKNSPRFFALTCDMVGEAFAKLKDIGSDFDYVFATAAHISAKIREELKEIDYEQWKALPVERIRPEGEINAQEKPKSKTRKVAKDFDIYDFLKFYDIAIDNETDNNIGHCIRLATCPFKGEPHVGHNATSTNFIYPCKDEGLAFHCNSTGCCDYGIAEVIRRLEEVKGKYPKRIYEPQEVRSTARAESSRGSRLETVSLIEEKPRLWLWPGYLERNKLVHFAGASSAGKSPVTLDLIARCTSGADWPDGTRNEAGPRSAILLAGEDDWQDTVRPRLRLAGACLDLVFKFVSTIKRGEETHDVATALDRDVEELATHLKSRDDVGMVVIDPITNYLGDKSMNKEDEMRSILMPLSYLAQQFKTCIITVGHLNKREDAATLNRLMGAQAFSGVARQVFMFGDDPDDDDKFSHVMGLARTTSTPSLKYRTESVQEEIQGVLSEVVKVKWLGLSSASMDKVITPSKQSEKSNATKIRAAVQAILRDGSKSSAQIKEALEEQGLLTPNWQAAASKVAVSKKLKGRDTGFEWYLPTNQEEIFDEDR